MDRYLSIDAPTENAASVMLLGLGANVGDRAANLREGLLRLTIDGTIRVEAVSGLWASEPVDAAGGEFFNAAARVHTMLSPTALLQRIKVIEAAMGRTGSGGDARPLDVDILYCGGLVQDDAGLCIPHPRRLDRAFVLAPLAEVCGDDQDPDVGRPVAEVARGRLRALEPTVRRVAGPEWFCGPTTTGRRRSAPEGGWPEGAMR